jgi:hypothetical protein
MEAFGKAKEAWFADRDQWEKLRSFGVVESIRDIKGSVTTVFS